MPNVYLLLLISVIVSQKFCFKQCVSGVLKLVFHGKQTAKKSSIKQGPCVASSTQTGPAIIEGVSLYSPCLFGKGIIVHARQTYIQQTKTFTKTKLI